MSWLTSLFNPTGFPARWSCGQWSAELGWIHIGADLMIFAAYMAIPVIIAAFVRHRGTDVVFTRLYWLFAAFIFSCGFGHLVEAGLFWYPVYRFDGLVKVVTAVSSWATVAALVQVLPVALTLPGAMRLNEALRAQITERDRAEAEVRRLNAQLQHRVEELETLLDLLPVAIGIAEDPTGERVRVNAWFARMLRMDKAENVSSSGPSAPTHFAVYHDGRELPPEEQPLHVTAREGRPIRGFDVEIRFSDGARILGEANTAPLFDGDAIRGALVALMDVTARREAEDQRMAVERRLQETQKLESLGVLAGGIAHDFNNLLTGIIGNASLARTELSASSPLHEYLLPIEQASMRAADLCRQMLAYAGKGKFVVRALDLSEVVRETAGLLRSSIDPGGVLRVETADALPPIVADPTQVRQVVMNLVLNASEALEGQPGTVRVGAGVMTATREYLDSTVLGAELPVGEYVFVEVADSGRGMSPDVLKRILDPFFTTKFTGRGLGLAAAQGIVRSHRGTLRVYSEPGDGTVFKVLFPRSDEPVQVDPAADRPLVWRGTGVVLVVDDEPTVRTTAARVLTALGFEVIQAGSGAEGISCFDQRRAEIVAVLLDLTMPGMDGEATFLALRERDPAVQILLMSGFNQQDAIRKFIGKGLAGFVQKPFRLEDLRENLRRLLDRGT